LHIPPKRVHRFGGICKNPLVAGEIDQALVGEKRHLDAFKSEQEGPFAQALTRTAEIVDGASIEDIEKARADLVFLFGFLHHLRGGFHSSLWEILAPAHERLAEMITEREAKALLGKHSYWMGLDMRMGHIHPLVKGDEDESFRAYDSTFLGEPVNARTR
jgi:hypothetical protein